MGKMIAQFLLPILVYLACTDAAVISSLSASIRQETTPPATSSRTTPVQKDESNSRAATLLYPLAALGAMLAVVTVVIIIYILIHIRKDSHFHHNREALPYGTVVRRRFVLPPTSSKSKPTRRSKKRRPPPQRRTRSQFTPEEAMVIATVQHIDAFPESAAAYWPVPVHLETTNETLDSELPSRVEGSNDSSNRTSLEPIDEGEESQYTSSSESVSSTSISKNFTLK